MIHVHDKESSIMAKRTQAQRDKARADRLFSQYVRLRDGHCTVCHTTNNLQCAHIVSRRFSATRCVDDNAHALCAGCHMRLTEEPHEHVCWAYRMVGEARYAELRRLAREGGKGVDWRHVGDRLAEQIRGLTTT